MRTLGATGMAAAVAALVILPALLLSCAARSPAPVTDPRPPADAAADAAIPLERGPCRTMPGDATGGADLVLALNEAVDPANAPVAATHAERIVFANIYETLVRMTCEGELVGGLAERWEPLDLGRRWRLSLRQDALLWDGTPVTAQLVIDSWQRNAALAAAQGRPFPGAWIDAIRQGLSAVEEHILQIDLDGPWNGLPRLLAHPDLAVAVDRPGWRWPLGSGPCRLSAGSDLPLPDLVCRPNVHHIDRPSWASMTFRVLPGLDARDLLQDGIDLAVFRGWRTAAYFAQLADVQVAPLPWSSLYLLLLPADTPLDPALLGGMTHAQATLADSTPWTSLFLHDCRPASCPLLLDRRADAAVLPRDPTRTAAALQQRQILYPSDDADARALADRLTAFLPPGFASQAADSHVLSASLLAGRAAGYVLRHDLRHQDPCFVLYSLLIRAGWLRPSTVERGFEADGAQDLDPILDPCSLALRMQQGGLALPLAATRAHLAWRGPLAGLELTHDGVPRIARLGRASRPEDLP